MKSVTANEGGGNSDDNELMRGDIIRGAASTLENIGRHDKRAAAPFTMQVVPGTLKYLLGNTFHLLITWSRHIFPANNLLYSPITPLTVLCCLL